MNWFVKWLVGLGLLRLHRFAYWVSFVGAPVGAGGCQVWVFGHRIRSVSDVAELEEVMAEKFGHACRILSWDRLRGDDLFVRQSERRFLGSLLRRRQPDTGSGGAEFLGSVFVLCLVIWVIYVVGSTLGFIK